MSECPHQLQLPQLLLLEGQAAGVALHQPRPHAVKHTLHPLNNNAPQIVVVIIMHPAPLPHQRYSALTVTMSQRPLQMLGPTSTTLLLARDRGRHLEQEQCLHGNLICTHGARPLLRTPHQPHGRNGLVGQCIKTRVCTDQQ